MLLLGIIGIIALVVISLYIIQYFRKENMKNRFGGGQGQYEFEMLIYDWKCFLELCQMEFYKKNDLEWVYKRTIDSFEKSSGEKEKKYLLIYVYCHSMKTIRVRGEYIFRDEIRKSKGTNPDGSYDYKIPNQPIRQFDDKYLNTYNAFARYKSWTQQSPLKVYNRIIEDLGISRYRDFEETYITNHLIKKEFDSNGHIIFNVEEYNIKKDIKEDVWSEVKYEGFYYSENNFKVIYAPQKLSLPNSDW